MALDGLARGQGDSRVAIATIRDREHDADDIIRKTLHEVRQTFLAPFDRGAITSLIGAMDDVIDEMQSAASAIELMNSPILTRTCRKSPGLPWSPRTSSPKPCRCCVTLSATANACTS
ncbi:MAG: DUF47 domain-containing protein [Novosphingobium sp.]